MAPRCLPLKAAAEYVGVPPGSLEKHGPKPIKIGVRKVWDVHALDAWIDSLGGRAQAGSLDEEKAKAMEGLECWN